MPARASTGSSPAPATRCGANIENLILTGNARNGTGNGLDNVITGNALANTLSGGGGHDELVGGGGSDILIGKTGADLFRFNALADAGPNGDLIVDFDAREDLIALENSSFGLAAPGNGIFGNGSGRAPLAATACSSIQARPRKPPLRP